jgi:hypothetical protein
MCPWQMTMMLLYICMNSAVVLFVTILLDTYYLGGVSESDFSFLAILKYSTA